MKNACENNDLNLINRPIQKNFFKPNLGSVYLDNQFSLFSSVLQINKDITKILIKTSQS
jgi:hypothetical protein